LVPGGIYLVPGGIYLVPGGIYLPTVGFFAIFSGRRYKIFIPFAAKLAQSKCFQ